MLHFELESALLSKGRGVSYATPCAMHAAGQGAVHEGGLALALEECGSNIVNHALRRDAGQTFRVTLEQTGGALIMELRDRGPEFDPTQAPVPEKEADGNDRPPGGWGIQLVRRYTDEMRHTREGDQNVLRLTKRLVQATPHK